MLKKMYKRKGFSLVEAMIATSIVTIAAGGVLLPFTTGMSMQQEGKKHTLAAILASAKMEEIIADPFDQIVSANDDYSDGNEEIIDWSDSKLVGGIYSNYSREVSCNYIYTAQESGTGNPVYILVNVKVFYNDKEVVSINRLISKYK